MARRMGDGRWNEAVLNAAADGVDGFADEHGDGEAVAFAEFLRELAGRARGLRRRNIAVLLVRRGAPVSPPPPAASADGGEG